MKIINKLFLINIVSAFNINNNLNKNYNTKMYYKPSKVIEEVSKTSQFMGNEWTLSDFLNNLEKHNIEAASIVDKQDAIIVIDKQHEASIMAENIHLIKTIPPTANLIIDNFIKNHINFDVFVIPENPLTNIPFIVQFGLGYIILSFCINFIRSQQMGGMNMPNNPLNMMFKKPELTDVSTVDVNFSDVAGCEEAKNELVEVVDFLKNPERYADAGAKIPRGILLEGEPGTGKTLLARAVAGEAGVNFISASGSEFIEMFVGVGASRVRNLFNTAKENSPCVIFIDEIDAIGRQRGAGVNTGNDEREQTLNQILTNMDGFEKADGIIVLGATNRADILDSALVRPGRFDRKVNVPLPDFIGRQEISQVHFRNKNLGPDVDFRDIAALTSGFSGAELANLANEAAILSVRNNQTAISSQTIVDAYEKITIGIPNIEDTRSREIIELVAYHETGHTLMSLLFNEFFDVKRVTINANKGGAGGYTLSTPKERYQNFPTKKFFLANLIVTLGGRAAEVILYRNDPTNLPINYDNNYVFNNITNLDITTGASADLRQANSLARQYISQFGLDDIGGVSDSSQGMKPFLGREMAMGGDRTSEFTKKQIEEQVNYLIKFGFLKACEIIDKNIDSFNGIASLLKKNKTVSGKDLEKFTVTMINNL